ncbi:MAG TPA: cupredoxin domain-containing protein [Pyrinomonadaceae bacterium]|jgi:plastocyanin
MSDQLRKKFALILLTSLLSMTVVACSAGDRGAGNGSGTATTVGTPASDNTRASAASQAASNKAAGGVASQQVEMDDDVFKPAQLTIPAGTKVIWVNKGKKAHTVVSNDKLFDSGLVDVGAEFTHTFNTPGTYAVHCAPHAKMKGQIVVQ